MKTAICYLSCHHGNTRKVVEALAEAGGADLIDGRTRQMVPPAFMALRCTGL